MRPLITRRTFSFLAVLGAAFASLGTSPPAPDWSVEDSLSGEVTLEADEASTTLPIKVMTTAVATSVNVDITLDPPPVRGETIGETPIVLFASLRPRADAPDGGTPSEWLPVPSSSTVLLGDSLRHHVAADTTTILDLGFAWEGDPVDRSTNSGIDGFVSPDHRRRAPRVRRTIRWRAKASASGYDDAPTGARIDLERMP